MWLASRYRRSWQSNSAATPRATWPMGGPACRRCDGSARPSRPLGWFRRWVAWTSGVVFRRSLPFKWPVALPRASLPIGLIGERCRGRACCQSKKPRHVTAWSRGDCDGLRRVDARGVVASDAGDTLLTHILRREACYSGTTGARLGMAEPESIIRGAAFDARISATALVALAGARCRRRWMLPSPRDEDAGRKGRPTPCMRF